MGRDEIHDAERQAFDLRQGGDGVGVAQRAMRFDQDVHGQVVAAGAARVQVDQVDGQHGILHAAHFRHGDVGQAVGGGADDFHVAREKRAVDVVHAHADAVELVVVAGQQAGDHVGVGFFIAGAGAVFAVERDVEQGAKLLLQSNRFTHQLFRAGVVVASGEQQRLAFALE